MDDETQEWLTLKDVAAILEIDPGTAKAAMQRRPNDEPWVWGIQINKRVKFPRRRVEVWVQELKN